MSVALPFLEAMSPRLPAGRSGAIRTSPPLRMAFLYVPNGVHMPGWTPRSPGRGFDLPADPRAAPGASKTTSLVAERADLEPRAGSRRRRRRSRPRHGQLSDRAPPQEDRRRRPQGRRLGRPGWPPSRSATRPASRPSRSAARGARTPANATTATVVLISQTFRGAANPRPSPSRSIPAWSSIGSLAARPDSDGGEDLARDDRHNKSILDFVGEDARQLSSNAGRRRPPQAR